MSPQGRENRRTGPHAASGAGRQGSSLRSAPDLTPGVEYSPVVPRSVSDVGTRSPLRGTGLRQGETGPHALRAQDDRGRYPLRHGKTLCFCCRAKDSRCRIRLFCVPLRGKGTGGGLPPALRIAITIQHRSISAYTVGMPPALPMDVWFLG